MARWFVMLFVLALVVAQTGAARDIPNDKGGLADQKNFFNYGGVGGFNGIGSNGLPFGGVGGAVGGGGLGGTGGGLGGIIGTGGLGGLGGSGGGVVPVGGVVGGVVPGGGSGNLPSP
ncbi:unnamed protein product [Coffea canephora]|uniref:Uncharacterized protein n=1 Tax=Coffea canephora TaxID=49390 RepID=A0A068U6A5_COFCA|nr:unnamed protein product [Coffea canephora]